MKFDIEQPEFNKLIRKVLPAVGGVTGLPVCSTIKLEAMNGSIALTACDPQTLTLRSSSVARVRTGGAVCVAGKAMADIVGQMPPGKVTVDFSGEGRVRITAGRSAAHLNALEADMFPVVPEYDRLSYSPMEGLFKTIDKVVFAAAKSDDRPLLRGVYLTAGCVVAIDGHRMAVYPHAYELPKSTILPAEALAKLSKVFPGESVNVSFGSTEVHFHQDGCYGTLRGLEGTFPDYRRVIPSGAHTKAVVRLADLRQAMSLVNLVTDNQFTVSFQFSQGSLKLVAQSNETGSAECALECMYQGPDVAVGMNVDYVRQATSKMDAETVTLEVRQPTNPVAITDGGYLHVIMPKRL
jgi:DNA polymerase-3 subunit beta